jgi:uncharacterized protein affecting Mg2+/Co2+ transport
LADGQSVIMHRPVELPGLQVRLDRLVYRHDPENTPPDRPHVFIYFITIENQSERTVTLVGRRWVIEEATGRRQIVEGDKIVGETPCLPPGGHFSTTVSTSPRAAPACRAASTARRRGPPRQGPHPAFQPGDP